MPIGKDRYNVPAVGPYGNLYKIEMAADDVVSYASGAEIELGVLQAGTELSAFDLIHDAWGAGTTIALGYKYKNPSYGAAVPAGIRTATDSSAAVNTRVALVTPIVFDHDVIITVTVGGATTDAGPNYIKFRPEYRFLDT